MNPAQAEESNEPLEDNESKSWIDNVPEEFKETFKGFDSQEKVLETIGYKPPKGDSNWRDSLEEEDRKVADRFASEADMVRSIKEARKRESLVRVPGKDATDEEKATYYKAIGVPETSDGYKFEVPEGVELTPEIEANNKEWAEILHKERVPVKTVNALISHIQKQAEAQQKAEIEADADFVVQGEAALKSEWKGQEYERNKTAANQAFKTAADRAGVNIEDLKRIETKEGRFLMDHPAMLRMFAVFGREMSEGSLGPVLTNDERETMSESLTELRGKIAAATERGDSKTANALYQSEQKLIAKMNGNKRLA